MNSTPCGVRGTIVRNLRLLRADVSPKSMKSGGKAWSNSEIRLKMPGSMMATLRLTCFYKDRRSTMVATYITNLQQDCFYQQDPPRSPKHPVGYQGAHSVQSSR